MSACVYGRAECGDAAMSTAPLYLSHQPAAQINRSLMEALLAGSGGDTGNMQRLAQLAALQVRAAHHLPT